MTTNKIAQLPQAILQNIKDFFIVNDLSIYEINRLRFDGTFDYINWLEGQEAWRLLLSCFKGENGYWKDVIRKEMMDYQLNHYYSQKYLLDPAFRERVLSCLRNSYRQLSIDLSHNSISTLTDEEGAILSDLRRVNLSNSCYLLKRLPPISNVYELSLFEMNLEGEITTLSDIKILHLSHNHMVTKITGVDGLIELRAHGCTSLKEITPLPLSLKKLSYTRSNALDTQFSQLKDLEELSMLSFRYNKDLQMPVPWFLPKLRKFESSFNILHLPTLYSLPKLEVFYWEKPSRNHSNISKELIKEHVSALLDHSSEFFSHIKEFTFSRKTHKIFNFSHYLQIEDLTIEDVDKLEGLENLSTLKKVSVLNSTSLNNLQVFKHCSLVILNNCPSVTDVSALSHVREVIIDSCLNLADVSGLGQRNRRVEIVHCDLIKDVSSLGKVRHLILDFCTGVEDVSALSHVPYLSLRGCTEVQDFSGFNSSNQRYLNLTGCEHLEDHHLPALADIHELIISYCNSITDISVLRNKRLTARNCSGLSEARLYGDHMIKVDLSNCFELRRVLIYGNVYALRLLETVVEMSSVFVLGSLKYMTGEFEYPNSEESHKINQIDEDELNTDEGDDYPDEDEIEDEVDNGDEEEDDYDSEGEDEHWEDVDEDDDEEEHDY